MKSLLYIHIILFIINISNELPSIQFFSESCLLLSLEVSLFAWYELALYSLKIIHTFSLSHNWCCCFFLALQRRVDFLQLMIQGQISEEQAENSSDEQPVKGKSCDTIQNSYSNYQTMQFSLQVSLFFNRVNWSWDSFSILNFYLWGLWDHQHHPDLSSV